VECSLETILQFECCSLWKCCPIEIIMSVQVLISIQIQQNYLYKFILNAVHCFGDTVKVYGIEPIINTLQYHLHCPLTILDKELFWLNEDRERVREYHCRLSCGLLHTWHGIMKALLVFMGPWAGNNRVYITLYDRIMSIKPQHVSNEYRVFSPVNICSPSICLPFCLKHLPLPMWGVIVR
jgi:hypothetical protein